MTYPAHVRIEPDGSEVVQTVQEHCEAVARYAGDCLKSAGLYHTAYLAGLLHDMGKAQSQFAQYIEKAARNEAVRRGSVIHTFQGCRYSLETWHSKEGNPDLRDLTAEIIAYAIGAHHGLFDCTGIKNKEHGFKHRMNASNISYEETTHAVHSEQGRDRKDINSLFAKAEKECIDKVKEIQKILEAGRSTREKRGLDSGTVMEKYYRESCFYLGMETRLLLSSVIEGDRRDTAGFMTGAEYLTFGILNQEDRKKTWERLLAHMEKKLELFPMETPIQHARKRISDMCKEFASQVTGIYRLNVPTGAGKTLSALRYALAHAACHDKRKIIFTAPLLSIIDQNAQIIREYIGDDSIVLEHHSNIGDDVADGRGKQYKKGDSTEQKDAGEESADDNDDLNQMELMTESWNAPIIITSMVQLLQTLFSGKLSCIRRLQGLCGSVIVIDEVQTIPANMLSLFNLAANFLSEICDVTFLLCSATQPCLEETDYPLVRIPEDVVPFNEKLWEPFQRTKIQTLRDRKLVDIPDLILEEAEKANSLLVICNKKTEAEYLYRQVKDHVRKCFHLSAAMCMAHRKTVLHTITEALKDSRHGGPGIVCITTQVIEAGVDISFERVIRFMAGMDSVVQAAGRCNRNGENPVAPVYVINCADENLANLEEIRNGKRATQDLVTAFHYDPKKFHNDLNSAEAVNSYYRRLYEGMSDGYQDYPIDKKRGFKSGVSILSMLSDNKQYCSECKDFGHYVLNQAFAEAGALFQVFDGGTTDAVCPYGRGGELIHELEMMHEGGYVPLQWLGEWLKRIKPYTVSLYEYQRKGLERNGGVYEMSGVLILKENHYDQDIGIIRETEEDFFV